jgi:hypothetical protein
MFNLRNATAAALVLGLVCTAAGVAEAVIIPSNIGGNVLWLDADDPSTFTFASGTQVAQWRDKSAAGGNHASTTTNYPTLQAGAIGGKPAVRFQSTQAGPSFTFSSPLTIPGGLNVAANQDRTVFLVMDYSVQIGNNEMFGTSTTNMVDVGNWSRPRRLRLRQTNNTFSASNSLPLGSHLLAIVGDAAGSYAWREGTPIINSTNKHFHWAMNVSMQVGGAHYSGREYHGDLAEMIVYDRKLTGWEMNEVGYYLAEKYGFDTDYVVPEPATLVVWSLLAACGFGLTRRRRTR